MGSYQLVASLRGVAPENGGGALKPGHGKKARAGFVRPLGEAHRRFMRRTKVLGGFDREAFEPARARSLGTLGTELDDSVREALLSLTAAKVMVRSGGASRRGLGAIPTVLYAIRSLWLRSDVPDLRPEAAGRESSRRGPRSSSGRLDRIGSSRRREKTSTGWNSRPGNGIGCRA